MEVPVSQVGARIRSLRQQAGLSLSELAVRSQVSKGVLSQIERGTGNPSLMTLWKVARALGTPVVQLMESPGSNGLAVRKNERVRVSFPRSRVEYQLLTPPRPEPKLSVVILEFEPQTPLPRERFTHAGEEFILILEGCLDVYLGDAVVRLETGDAFTFPSSIPHDAVNPGPSRCVAFSVTSPPTF